MIQIDNNCSRLSAWGTQGNVIRIGWYKPPRKMPTPGAPIDYSGAVIRARFEDGTIEDITEFCGFLPIEGSEAPYAGSITATAFYNAKSGETFMATIKLPICYPAELRLVVGNDIILKERYYNVDSELYDADTMPLNKDSYRLWCIWKQLNIQTGEEVVVRITPVNKNEAEWFYGRGWRNYYGDGYRLVQAITGADNVLTDVENYHTIFTPTVESFERALEIYAEAVIAGTRLYSNRGMFEETRLKLRYVNFPTTFVDDAPVRFTNKNIRFSWDGVELVEPVEGLDDMWLGVAFGSPSVGPLQEFVYGYFHDGDEGDFYPMRHSPRRSLPDEPYNEHGHYHYKCTGNEIEWTLIEE